MKCHKRRYSTQDEAYAAKRRIEKEKMTVQMVYMCGQCKVYHTCTPGKKWLSANQVTNLLARYKKDLEHRNGAG